MGFDPNVPTVYPSSQYTNGLTSTDVSAMTLEMIDSEVIQKTKEIPQLVDMFCNIRRADQVGQTVKVVNKGRLGVGRSFSENDLVFGGDSSVQYGYRTLTFEENGDSVMIGHRTLNDAEDPLAQIGNMLAEQAIRTENSRLRDMLRLAQTNHYMQNGTHTSGASVADVDGELDVDTFYRVINRHFGSKEKYPGGAYNALIHPRFLGSINEDLKPTNNFLGANGWIQSENGIVQNLPGANVNFYISDDAPLYAYVSGYGTTSLNSNTFVPDHQNLQDDFVITVSGNNISATYKGAAVYIRPVTAGGYPSDARYYVAAGRGTTVSKATYNAHDFWFEVADDYDTNVSTDNVFSGEYYCKITQAGVAAMASGTVAVSSLGIVSVFVKDAMDFWVARNSGLIMPNGGRDMGRETRFITLPGANGAPLQIVDGGRFARVAWTSFTKFFYRNPGHVLNIVVKEEE